MVILTWRNRFSGETGYVKSISKTEGHFVNTNDVHKAKKYKSDAGAKQALRILNELGETQNNEFFVSCV